MRTFMLGLLAETSIHPGSGRSMGVVDLPVAREASTDFPTLVGSSLKGALSDKARAIDLDQRDERFGKQDHAGELLISDARLLLLPVRCLTGSYRWATCPHLLERYRRDLARAGLDPHPEVPTVDPGTVLAKDDGHLYLEERQFAVKGTLSDNLTESIGPLILHSDTRGRLGHRIAVLNDDDFAWFARFGLAIQARNVLEKGTKKSKNLWYEETLPPDTVMYSLIMARNDKAADALLDLFPDSNPYLQAGGNETVGQGWFAVAVRLPEETSE